MSFELENTDLAHAAWLCSIFLNDVVTAFYTLLHCYYCVVLQCCFHLFLSVLVWWTILRDSSLKHPVHQTETKAGLKRDDAIISASKFSADEENFSFGHLIKLFQDFDWTELWDLFLIKFFAGLL